MTCPRERDLALYVEGDLAAAEALALQEHVLGCAGCRRFLLDLEASQRALKALAEAPIAAEAFAELRRRAVAATAAPTLNHSVRWAIAATVAVATVGLILSVSSRPSEKRQASVVPPAPSVVATPEPRVGAVAPTPAPVRPIVREHPSVARPAQAVVATGMTPEETDQFVRALVAVSKVESLDDLERPEPAPTTPPLVRIASDDPNVAIYWRLEPTGGK